MPSQLVIDANVVAKWFLKDSQESDTELAADILIAFLSNEIELHAPRIMTYEVCSLLTRACAGGKAARLAKADAIQGAREFFGLSIQFEEATEEQGVKAIDMAVRFSKTHADMTYLSLAIRLDCNWCTADLKVLDSVTPSFPSSRVLLLSQFSSV